jgi:hypothetical protein
VPLLVSLGRAFVRRHPQGPQGTWGVDRPALKLKPAWSRRKPKPVEPEILTPVQPTWMPTRDIERAVYAALILAGEPVNNRRLAELMDCSPGEASRRVA